ncbi:MULTISPECIES: ABC transporter permease [Staphylococcus]|uniref:ABC transporter permease n=1 Tax=Staphylococcus TaxID=1279 RepID=UPI00070A70C9|nr:MULTISPECIES: ABC transporter permease [Staphylococcus]MBC2999078.1 ABC transporter permease [Staphylococcus epidermidis]MBC3052549.1 ABC transporter permease [Staphylococcus epidermidis]MBC3063694.1 ABC transporter permease [Staphylococcus epidermidis]OHQ86563.1 teichoic acid ABC transporter permease [Staphylococcus sp. HMSC074F11]
MKAPWFIIREHISNIYLIKRLAEFQMKISNKNNYLGVIWEVLNPFIQILMYWFIFGLGFRSNRSIEGTPFIFWLIVGISMWFFINQGILEGTKSITSKYKQVAKMNFPLSILPSYLVVSKFYSHIILLIIVTTICWVGGFAPSIYTVQLILFIPYTLLLTMAIVLLTSTLGAIIRDIQMIIQSGMRMVFFVSSILYLPTNPVVLNVIKLNPIYFIAEGYRSAILYHQWFFITNWQLVVYNVLFLIITFIIGSVLHVKYRDHFADYV